MKVTYAPDGEEPKVFNYNPNKLMSAEREALERRTGKPFMEFAQGVLTGDSKCRRALLHALLKRQDPTLNFEDVDFAWDDLTFEMTKGEIQLAADELRKKKGTEEMVENMLAGLDEAPEDEGKARLPFVV